ncbi:hypothetical protein ACLOJK_022274 [Asimina triloba]
MAAVTNDGKTHMGNRKPISPYLDCSVISGRRPAIDPAGFEEDNNSNDSKKIGA